MSSSVYALNLKVSSLMSIIQKAAASLNTLETRRNSIFHPIFVTGVGQNQHYIERGLSYNPSLDTLIVKKIDCPIQHSLLISVVNSVTGVLSFDCQNYQHCSFRVTLTENISSIIFTNTLPNGEYNVFLQGGLMPCIIQKNSCINNLNGNMMVGVNSIFVLRGLVSPFGLLLKFENFV